MIHILFFAQLREQLDCDSLDWPLENSISVSELTSLLVVERPAWGVFLRDKKVLCAVNQTLVKGDARVASGDEVAFFPPVTGG